MSRLIQVAFALAAGLALVAPIGAAEECETERLDYYLLKDGTGQPRLSGLAPSAANATTWTFKLPVYHEDAEKRVRLGFPSPNYEIDEEAGIAGAVKVAAKPSGNGGPLPPHILVHQHPEVEVVLREGERGESLGEGYPYSSPVEIELEGEFPGHGDDGGAHTHGAGDDADRGLLLSDLAIELVFRVHTFSPVPVQPFANHDWEFSVYIEGSSFVHLEALADAAPPPETKPAPPPPSKHNETGNKTTPNETAPPDDNSTLPDNGTGPNSGGFPEGGPALLRALGAPKPGEPASILPYGAGLLGTGLIGLFTWRRGTRKR